MLVNLLQAIRNSVVSTCVKWPKNNKWCQNMLEIDDVALNAAYWTQKKSGVQISLKTLKCPCNRWVLVRNPDTPKEFVQFVHEVRPVFSVTLSTLSHMLCGWNDDTMRSFNIFRVHFCSDFQFHRHLAL